MMPYMYECDVILLPAQWNWRLLPKYFKHLFTNYLSSTVSLLGEHLKELNVILLKYSNWIIKYLAIRSYIAEGSPAVVGSRTRPLWSLDTGGSRDEAGGNLDKQLQLAKMRWRRSDDGSHKWQFERQSNRWAQDQKHMADWLAEGG